MRDILKQPKQRPEGAKVPSTAGRNSGEPVVEYGWGTMSGMNANARTVFVETRFPT